MKKITIAFALAAAMMLAACGGNGGKDISAPSQEDVQKSAEDDIQKEDNDASRTESEDASQAEDNGASQTESEEVSRSDSGQMPEYSLGEFTDTGYQSSYMGYQFTTPEGCALAAEEELAEMAGMSAEILEEDLGKQFAEMAKNSVVFDLYAIYPDTNTNINVTLTPNTMNITDINLVADASIQQLEAMETMEVKVSEERSTVQVAGKDYLFFTADTSYEDIAIKQECYMTLYNDKIISMAISYQEGNEAQRDALLAAFSEF